MILYSIWLIKCSFMIQPGFWNQYFGTNQDKALTTHRTTKFGRKVFCVIRATIDHALFKLFYMSKTQWFYFKVFD